MNEDIDVATLSDEQLLLSLKACVADEKRSLVKVLVRINEVDRRELYAKQMHYGSLYAFTLKELGYSEDAAYRRIVVAQAANKYPILYPWLTKGRISLSAAAKVAKHLKPENYKDLLDRCEKASCRDIDRLLAQLYPAQDQPRDRVRFLGAAPPPAMAAEISLLPLTAQTGDTRAQGTEIPTPTGVEPERTTDDGSAAVIATGAGAECSRVEVRFPADEEFYRRLERARALLRHKYPAGRFGEIMSDALIALLDRIDPQCRLERRKRRAQRTQPSDAAAKDLNAPKGGADNRRRAIPARIRDEVWNRDGSRCAFIGADGRRCEETHFLEIDHIVPVALGGRSDDGRGLRLLCRNHNGIEARRILGAERMAPYTRKT